MTDYRDEELVRVVERARSRIILAAGLTTAQAESAAHVIAALEDFRAALLDEQEPEA